jgi:putative membrane protein
VLTSSASELYKAGEKLNEGIAALRDGLSSYKEGTAEFKDKTSDIDGQISSKADELIRDIFGDGSQTVSFVSDKNTKVDSVQFVLKTAAIEKTGADKAPEQAAQQLNFWQKLLKLFGL